MKLAHVTRTPLSRSPGRFTHRGTGSKPASELIVVIGSLNRHNGRNVDAYNGVHVRRSFGESTTDG